MKYIPYKGSFIVSGKRDVLFKHYRGHSHPPEASLSLQAQHGGLGFFQGVMKPTKMSCLSSAESTKT